MKARGVGPPKGGGDGGGREGGASSRGNSVGYRQILAQMVEVKGVQSIFLNVINILEGQTLAKVGGEGEFDGPVAQKQQLAQAAAKTQQRQQQAANRNTSNKKSSNKQQSQEHKQHKQQPRKSEGQEVWVPKVGRRGGVVPWNFGCVRGFFFWIHNVQ